MIKLEIKRPTGKVGEDIIISTEKKYYGFNVGKLTDREIELLKLIREGLEKLQ